MTLVFSLVVGLNLRKVPPKGARDITERPEARKELEEGPWFLGGCRVSPSGLWLTEDVSVPQAEGLRGR